MNRRPDQVLIYHITDVENLPGILADGGLHSDAVIAGKTPAVIGYDHIKARRLKELRVPCCEDRFVGAFVPFYFCPRSPMLYIINIGGTGRLAGCQQSVIHLVSTVAAGIGSGRAWAISSGNAGAFYASFAADLSALGGLDWAAIRATDWKGRISQKSAELLVADFFPWAGIHAIGCHNSDTAARVRGLIKSNLHRPPVTVEPTWYY